MLRRRIADEFLPRVPTSKLAVSLESFGFKHGPARDADMVLDVRFLPNPALRARPAPAHRPRPAVVDYVGRDGQLEAFYERLEPLLDYLLPQYVAEGKAHLTIAIGCTGGRHRSVAVTEHLARRWRERDDVFVEVAHRDITQADRRDSDRGPS